MSSLINVLKTTLLSAAGFYTPTANATPVTETPSTTDRGEAEGTARTVPVTKRKRNPYAGPWGGAY
ncbi:MAG: hypothetical protein IT381_01340 [Deltaproteobacteria bacterium]|nr:hypothetical protein [Deltaproteobacteria bacterium]